MNDNTIWILMSNSKFGTTVVGVYKDKNKMLDYMKWWKEKLGAEQNGNVWKHEDETRWCFSQNLIE